jgi:hypothetical protein
MCRMDKYGFPGTGAKGAKRVRGFQTGDIVKAVLIEGKKRETYTGRVAVRSSGFFNLTTPQGVVQGISSRFYHLLHWSDGYEYGHEQV